MARRGGRRGSSFTAAMLKAIGVESYYTLVSTDRGVIDPKFASVAGFNHVVIAIKLPEAKDLPATVKGNLLLFDPTSAATPFGTLPPYLQDNDLLLVRPRVLGSKAEGTLDLKERTYAYESDGPSLETDEIDIALPPGFAADELPEPLALGNKVASYKSETKLENQTLHYRRQYRIDAFVVPRADLPELNGLFTKIAADERASAVLKGR